MTAGRTDSWYGISLCVGGSRETERVLAGSENSLGTQVIPSTWCPTSRWFAHIPLPSHACYIHTPSKHPSPNRYSGYSPGRTGRLSAQVTNFVFSKTLRLRVAPAQPSIQRVMEVLCPGWRGGISNRAVNLTNIPPPRSMIRLRILLPLHAFKERTVQGVHISLWWLWRRCGGWFCEEVAVARGQSEGQLLSSWEWKQILWIVSCHKGINYFNNLQKPFFSSATYFVYVI